MPTVVIVKDLEIAAEEQLYKDINYEAAWHLDYVRRRDPKFFVKPGLCRQDD